MHFEEFKAGRVTSISVRELQSRLAWCYFELLLLVNVDLLTDYFNISLRAKLNILFKKIFGSTEL